MTAPSVALQGAINTALKADADLIAHFGGVPRIYDKVPDEPVFPYIRIGDDQPIPIPIGCGSAWEIYSTVHVWTQPEPDAAMKGKVEAKNIAWLIEQTFETEGAVTPVGYVVKSRTMQTTRVMDDPDGVSIHGVVTCRFLVTN